MIYTGRSKLVTLMGNRACRMVTLEDPAVYQINDGFLAMAMGMPKLQAAVNDLLSRLHEMGILWRLKSRWISPKEEECEPEDVTRALTMMEFLPVLAVLLPGFVFSVVFLLAEWGWVRLTTYKAHQCSVSHRNSL